MDSTQRAKIGELTTQARALLAAIDEDGNRRLDEAVTELQNVVAALRKLFPPRPFSLSKKASEGPAAA
jgi:hypothetical protein